MNDGDPYVRPSATGRALMRATSATSARAAIDAASTSDAAAATAHAARTDNPHGVDKSQVGLGNVPNVNATQRGNHTGTQTLSTISDAGTAASRNTGTTSGTVPLLGVDGKLDSSTLPALAISEFLGTVASQIAMINLSGERGDWCIRSDQGKTYVLTTDNPSSPANWQAIATPTDLVTSVNGRTGNVNTTATDITDSTSTGRAVLTATDAAAARTAIGAAASSHTHLIGHVDLLAGELDTLANAAYSAQLTADDAYSYADSAYSLADSAYATATTAASIATGRANLVGSGAHGALTVSLGTTNVTLDRDYSAVTVSGGTVIFGVDNTAWGRRRIRVSGTLSISGSAVIRGAYAPNVHYFSLPGARKTTAGAGNPGQHSLYGSALAYGLGGGGAPGGGVGTLAGGNGVVDGYGASSWIIVLGWAGFTSPQGLPAGTTAAGADGSTPVTPAGFPSSPEAILGAAWARNGFSGGSGACKVAGGANYGGAGGGQGYGSQGLDIICDTLSITTGSGCKISCDGSPGGNGEDGNAVNANGDICGGGGGAGGGAGGLGLIRCRRLLVNGTSRDQAWVDAGNLSSVITANGGAGGAGGLGRQHNGTANQAYATGNGGTGGTGTAGKIVLIVTG